ncbi:hypothetical protein [[Clostridium] hylemonae]|nr:hypothetical protein [[Clostridium] hylemonae]
MMAMFCAQQIMLGKKEFTQVPGFLREGGLSLFNGLPEMEKQE